MKGASSRKVQGKVTIGHNKQGTNKPAVSQIAVLIMIYEIEIHQYTR